jgi:hypothetical protein
LYSSPNIDKPIKSDKLDARYITEEEMRNPIQNSGQIPQWYKLFQGPRHRQDNLKLDLQATGCVKYLGKYIVIYIT